MSGEMIERVARAIVAAMKGRSFDRCPAEYLRHIDVDDSDLDVVELARAAIEAMREPTDEQRNAYYALSYNTEVMIDAHWERAIDAALNASPPTESHHTQTSPPSTK